MTVGSNVKLLGFFMVVTNCSNCSRHGNVCKGRELSSALAETVAAFCGHQGAISSYVYKAIQQPPNFQTGFNILNF